MKSYILCTLFACSILFGQAQILPDNNHNTYKLKGSTQKVLTYNEIVGSPFRYTQFMESKVFFRLQDLPMKYKINYNAYNDELEYIEDGITYTICNPNEIHKVEVNNEVIIYTKYYNYDVQKEGYFIEIIDDYISLYKKELILNVLIKNSAYGNNQDKKAKFIKEKPRYYISIYGGPLTLIKTKKKLTQLFFNHPDVKKYIKEENIKMHSEDDLKKLVIFLNKFDKK